MKKIFLLFLLIILSSCSKPKTVLICGDHICINDAEAKRYFEENLSLEVKIINNKEKENIDLVELNLNTNKENLDKKISIQKKSKLDNNLKTLSNKEIQEIKEDLKEKKKKQKIAKLKKTNLDKKQKKKKESSSKIRSTTSNKSLSKINKRNVEVVDVCTLIKKCSIDEISKYLLKQSKKKGFPDISKR
tara:strand:+ start:732 stop:1298 length:567 start_codon:yes stop_codon:yes gene_type:complete